MQQVKECDHVTVEYQGRIKEGDVFETTAETGPLEFQLGSGAVLPAFEKALLGMVVGETRSVELPPEAAYGPPREELVQSFSPADFGDRLQPQPGMVLGMNLESNGQHHRVPGLVTTVSKEQVMIDFNHPLAGKTLVFTITLKAIEQPRPADAPDRIPTAGPSCPSSGCGDCH